jgi:hypothetical protein
MEKLCGKERERVSVMLLGSSNGTKKNSWVVFKQVPAVTKKK